MLTKILQIFLTLLIGIISLIGDKIIENADNLALRAVVDNLTHGLVAGISWSLIVASGQNSIIDNIPNIVLCAVISSLIDVDHFIEARSWKLNESVGIPAIYFYLACGIAGLLFCVLFFLVGVLFFKVNQLVTDGSNQLHRQRDTMIDFCYTNPMIVPGEELSRRGFSMYRGSDPMSMHTPGPVKNYDYAMFDESRSKF